jgi:3-dehydroquinate dehydratase-1
MGRTVEEFLQLVREVKDADIIEIRADGLRVESHNTREYRAHVKRLLRNARIQTDLPLILTVRGEKEGGVFVGSEAERVECIKEGIKLADAIDIELMMEKGWRDELLEEGKKMNKPIIVSYHEFDSTPEEEVMRRIIEEEVDIGADVAKLAVKANSLEDVIRLLQVTYEMSSSLEIPICTVSMGSLGKISRIAAPFFGSAIAYGYITGETAPGQLSVSDLRRTFEVLGLR